MGCTVVTCCTSLLINCFKKTERIAKMAVLKWLQETESPLNKSKRGSVHILSSCLSLPLLSCLLPSLPQVCTKRHCPLKSLHYITLLLFFLICLTSRCFHPPLCVLVESVSHLSWFCFGNHRVRVFLWSQLLKACLVHLRRAICWRVSEDPGLLLKSPCSPALSIFLLLPLCMMDFLGPGFSIWLIVSMSRVSDGHRDIL